MGRSMKNCISQTGIKPEKLTPVLKDIYDNDKSSDTVRIAAITSIDEHIKALKDQRKAYTTQHTNSVKDFTAEAISGTPAGKYINRESTDPDNELNLFTTKSLKNMLGNVIQRFGSVKGMFNEKFLNQKKITAADKEVIKDFTESFLPSFMSALETTFKPKKNANFRHEDFIQYFPERDAEGNPTRIQYKDENGLPLRNSKGQIITSKLDPALKGVIAASTYEWLATNAHKLVANDTRTMKSILGLDEKGILSDSAADHLEFMGMSADLIAEQLGSMIADRMNIKPGNDSDYHAGRRMEKSLGFMALATMEQLNLIERKEVFTGKVSDSTIPSKMAALLKKNGLPVPKRKAENYFGLAGLKTDMDLDVEDVFLDEENLTPLEVKAARIGNPTTFFYRMDTDRQNQFNLPTTPSHLQKAEELLKEAPDAFNKLFDLESSKDSYSWSKHKYPKRMKIAGTGEVATAQQTKNLIKYSHIPYYNNEDVTSLFFALGDEKNGDAFLKEMLGFKDLEFEHISREKNVNGNNLGISRDLENVKTWLKQAEKRKEAGLTTHFYIPNYFYSTMRMGQAGDINPQQSKMHRALFSQGNWKVSFDPLKEPDVDFAFHEALAFAFDIESNKVGGLEKQREKLDKFLQQRKIINAVRAIQAFQAGETLTDEHKRAIVDAVALGENKTHSLKGLVEYARYQSHKGGKFTTDLYKEIDGISNGPTIGSIQLIPNKSNKHTIAATLSMAGFNFSNRDVNVDERNGNRWLHDAYQRMGQEWAFAVHKMYNEAKHEKQYQTIRDMDAIEFLLGSFTGQEGIIEGVVRTLSKPRTMQTTYGAGIEKQLNILAFSDVIQSGIYDRLTNIAAQLRRGDELKQFEYDALVSEFKDVIRATTTLTDNMASSTIDISQYLTNGKLDPSKVLTFDIEYADRFAIRDKVADTYGAAMEEAIENIFSGLLEARKPLTTDVQLAVSTYNYILQLKIDAQLQHNDGNPVTKQQMKDIVDSMRSMYPHVKTPLYQDGNDGYLAVAKPDKTRLYNEDGTKVSAAFSEDTVAGLTGYVSGSPLLGKPGASPIVNIIHMLDSMVANHLMSTDVNFLNNHDGFTHSIKDSKTVREEANKRFYELMKDYSLAEAITEMRANVLSQAEQYLKENGLDLYGNDFMQYLVDDGSLTPSTIADLQGIPEKEMKQFFKRFYKDIEFGDAAAVKDKIAEYFIENPEMFNKAIHKIITESNSMAEQTKNNKEEFMNSTTQMQQYSDGGKGYDVPGAVAEDQLFTDDISPPVDTGNITQSDAANNQVTAHSIAKMIYDNNQLGSSNDSDSVSTNPNDYPDTRVVDSKNAVDVFEDLQQLDKAAKFGSVEVSADHQQHLKRILGDIVATVMRPVNLYINTHSVQRETQGIIQIDEKGNKNKIWIQTQPKSNHPVPGMLGQGIRMSSGEVYAHELIHHIVHAALSSHNGGHLRRQVAAIYNQARNQFTEKYGANAFIVFMNDPYADLTDPANAYEIMAAKKRWEYIFEPSKNPDNTHNGLDEFLAFGMTNENFMRELAQLEVDANSLRVRDSVLGVFEKNIQTTIANIFRRIMDFIHEVFYQQKHSKKMNEELENLVISLSQVDSHKKSALMRFAAAQEARLTALSVAMDNKVINKVKDTVLDTRVGKKTTATVRSTIDSIKHVPELHNVVSDQVRKLRNAYESTEYGMTRAIITELKGNTSRIRPLHDLLSKRNIILDSAKETAATDIKNTVNSWFDRELSDNEKIAITKAGMKTDVSGLLDYSSMYAIKDFLESANIREQRIKYLLKQIADDPILNPYRNYFEKKADDLGFFMVTGSAKHGGAPPMWNAFNIATLNNTKYEGYLSDSDIERARHLVEQLASLSAIRYTKITERNQLAYLISENMTAIERVFQQHNNLKEEALHGSFNGKRGKMKKGYVKQILNPRIQYEQGTLADKEMFEQAGFIMNATPIQRDPNDPVQTPIYMFKSMLGTANDYLSGIASFTSNKAKGVNSFRIQNQIGNVYSAATQGDHNRKIILRSMQNKLNAAFSSKDMDAVSDNNNYMIPQFDDDGMLVDARYMMTEQTKDQILEQHSHFDDILAGMTSQLIDKKQTDYINSDLVYALKDLYDAEYKDNPAAYVEISPYTSNERYRDLWYMMTPKMRQEITTVFGDDRLYISKDVVDLTFGNRKYTIGEMFNKTRKERNLFERTMVDVLNFTLGFNNILSKEQNNSRQGRALIRAKTVEDFMTQLTKLAKDNIIVRNFSVTRGNYASNMAYLKSKGMSLEYISKHSRVAIESALRYQSDKAKLEALRIQRNVDLKRHSLNQATKDRLIKKYDRLIIELENELALNPSTAMIEAGLMPNIVDDVDTGEVQSPYKHGIDKLIDSSLEMLPGKAQNVGRTLFMTEDTEGYKMLNNAVKMTDYVGRFVLYHHYTETQNMSHEDAVTAVNEEFINFDLPTHRLIEYANNIGLIWFSKYQLRVLKQIKNLIKEHPFTTIATFMIGKAISDDNILNSLPGITKDALQAFGDPMSVLTSSVDQILTIDIAETPFN
jgi:hypothetical protein